MEENIRLSFLSINTYFAAPTKTNLMIKLFASGTVLCLCLNTIPQNSLQNSIQTGFIFPANNDNGLLAAHNGKGLHFGNHFDYLLGVHNFRIGLGGYAGQLVAFEMSDYKETAQRLATKYRLATDRLRYKESPFRSAALMVGPIADWKIKKMNANFWAKGGYGINEPGRFSAIVQDAGAVSNVFSNQAGNAKNNFSYSIGGGIRYKITSMLGLQLAANYFNTKTELVNYNYDRDKGTTPYTFSASNNFIQANLGLSINLDGNQKEKTRKEYPLAKKEKPRKNDNDTIYFEARTVITHQTQGTTFGEKSLHPVNNYLTAFFYNTDEGIKISQCSGMKTPGDPIPGLDVKLKNTTTNQSYSIHTNEDGSFAVKDISDGIYHAIAANDTIVFAIENASSSPDYRLVQNAADECSSVTSNIIYAEDKMFAEVISPRDVATGQASGKRVVAPRDVATGQSSGKRMHQPLPVVNTTFHLNFNNIIRVGNLLYAEVLTAREAGSGMASGKRTIATGDIDGDGMADKIVEKAPGGIKQTMQTQVFVVNDDGENEPEQVIEYEIKSPRDVATGQSSGKRTYTITTNAGASDYEVKAPRDVATGQSSGKRINTNSNNYQAFEHEVKAPRDVATGQASGKRFAVQGSSGQQLELIVPMVFDMNTDAPLPGIKYDADPVGQSFRAVKTRSNIQNNRAAVKTRSNIQNNRTTENGLNNDGEEIDTNKATVNTTRSNIKHNKMGGNAIVISIDKINCANGACSAEAIISIDGIIYEATVSGVLKTKHDTVKNSIGNIP